MRVLGSLLLSAVAAVLPVAALADSISPASFSATLAVGDSVTIEKTVTVSAGAPVSSQVDVFFLADETGSMGPYIAAIEAAAASIIGSVSGLGDLRFGVGGYRDAGDAFTYREITDLTTGAAAAAAIPTWTAAGGGDYPEAAMYALSQVASQTTWRTGSERLVVWFGDAPADDVDVGGVTQAGVIATLNSLGISVLAINVGSLDYYSPYGVGFRGLNDKGQASAIASGTGGTFYDGINASSIVDTITDAITSAVATYTTVCIDASEAPAGVGVSAVPSCYTGSFDRSVERTFSFDVTFTGLSPGTYSFSLYGAVDGGRVATESDRITVTGGTPTVPEPGSIALLGAGLAALGLTARRRRSR